MILTAWSCQRPSSPGVNAILGIEAASRPLPDSLSWPEARKNPNVVGRKILNGAHSRV